MKSDKILKKLFTVMGLILAVTACSDKDKDKNGFPENGEKTNIHIQFDADEDFTQFADAYVLSYVNDEIKADMLDLSKGYEKEITGTNPADTLGFAIYLCTKKDVADGSYQGRFNVTCTATLNKDGLETGRRTITDSAKEFKAVISAEEDMTEQDTLMVHMFTVRNDALVELQDSPYDEEPVDERPGTPTIDNDLPFLSGHLHYYNNISTETDNTILSDNLAMRFTGRSAWSMEKLSYGDLLFIGGSDVKSIDSQVLKDAADEGTIFVFEGGRSDLETLCKAIGVPCLITAGCDDDMYFISKGVTEEDGMPKADPIFIRLTPHDEEGAYLDDYTEGMEVDMALKHVERYLSGTSDVRVAPEAETKADSPTQILNQLVSAYRVSVLLPQTVERKEYRKKNLKGLNDTQTNLYEVNYSIWNVFSLDEKRNFYYVHQELNAAFSPCYWNIYSKSVSGIAKVCEWYGKNVKTTLEPYQTDDMHLENSSPASTNGSTSYTSGVSFGLSGTVGYNNKGPMISASASLTFSSSTTYSIPDIIVYNRCMSGTKFEWEYDLADVRSSFSLIRTACSNFYPGAAAGRSTLVSGADFMFSFPESSGQPQMKATIETLLRSSCSKCGVTCKVRNKTATKSLIFELPYLTSSDFESNFIDSI